MHRLPKVVRGGGKETAFRQVCRLGGFFLCLELGDEIKVFMSKAKRLEEGAVEIPGEVEYGHGKDDEARAHAEGQWCSERQQHQYHGYDAWEEVRKVDGQVGRVGRDGRDAHARKHHGEPGLEWHAVRHEEKNSR